MLLRCFSDVFLFFHRRNTSKKIHSKHIIKYLETRHGKSITFGCTKNPFYTGSPGFHKSHLAKYIGNRLITNLGVSIHKFFISKTIVKSSRRGHFQSIIINRYLNTGIVYQITMTMGIYNHFADSLQWKFIRLLPNQSINRHTKTNISQYKICCLYNLLINRT